jgi:hypothetical protein
MSWSSPFFDEVSPRDGRTGAVTAIGASLVNGESSPDSGADRVTAIGCLSTRRQALGSSAAHLATSAGRTSGRPITSQRTTALLHQPVDTLRQEIDVSRAHFGSARERLMQFESRNRVKLGVTMNAFSCAVGACVWHTPDENLRSPCGHQTLKVSSIEDLGLSGKSSVNSMAQRSDIQTGGKVVEGLDWRMGNH